MGLQKLFSREWLQNKFRMKMYAGDVRRLVAQNKVPDVETSLRRIKQYGINPKLIFDVGAYEGDFIKMCKRLWPDSRIVAFEALPEKINDLKKNYESESVEIVHCLVGDQDQASVPFYSDENASSALFSEEVNTHKQVLNLPMMKLDSFISSHGGVVPDFLQLDTLSFEYQILKGIEGHLPKIQAILLQVNFIDVFHEVKLANKVIELLAAHGFVIYDVCDLHRRPLDHALWQADLLFLKEDSPLRKDKRWGIS